MSFAPTGFSEIKVFADAVAPRLPAAIRDSFPKRLRKQSLGLRLTKGEVEKRAVALDSWFKALCPIMGTLSTEDQLKFQELLGGRISQSVAPALMAAADAEDLEESGGSGAAAAEDGSLPQPTAAVKAGWENHFSAFGEQDVDKILKDYTEDSRIVYHNFTAGVEYVFTGLSGVKACFTGIFADLSDTSKMAVHELTVAEESVFLVWSCVSSNMDFASDVSLATANKGHISFWDVSSLIVCSSTSPSIKLTTQPTKQPTNQPKDLPIRQDNW